MYKFIFIFIFIFTHMCGEIMLNILQSLDLHFSSPHVIVVSISKTPGPIVPPVSGMYGLLTHTNPSLRSA